MTKLWQLSAPICTLPVRLDGCSTVASCNATSTPAVTVARIAPAQTTIVAIE
jgi:hypothetical protein